MSARSEIDAEPDRAEASPLRPHRRHEWWWRAVGVALLLTYNTWLLIVPVNGHPQIMNGYLSELSASDQPHNLFFRTGDEVSAWLVLAVGLVAWNRWTAAASLHGGRRAVRWWQVSAAGLVLFAVSTGLDAVSSMDCSPTLSAACAVAEKAGRLSFAHYLHTYTSVGAQMGIVATMVAALLAERTGDYRVVGPGATWAVAVIEVGSLAVMMGMLAHGVPGIGWPQAVMVATASVWFCLVAFGLALRQGPEVG